MSSVNLHLIYDLMYLVKCAIEGIVPDSVRIASLDLHALYQLAENHNMTAVTAMALESAGIRDEAFLEARGKAIRKAVCMETDMHLLTAQLEADGIWYMPLKGAVLKDYYPKLGMRQMSDYDILYDLSFAERVREILTGLGFHVDEYNMHNVDSYEKPPVSRFEMHRRLFSPYLDDRLYHYYENVRDRLLPDEGTEYALHFSPEDFYVYMLAHEYKHYITGGNGLRFLMDTFVFLRRFGETLDTRYIDAELEKLGITEFAEHNLHLVRHLFDGAPLLPEEEDMLEYMAEAGTFGTVNNAVSNRVEALGGGMRGKLRFAKERILIPMKTLESAYPFFYRHKALIPFLYPYRAWKLFFRSREKAAAELKALLRTEGKKKKQNKA